MAAYEALVKTRPLCPCPRPYIRGRAVPTTQQTSCVRQKGSSRRMTRNTPMKLYNLDFLQAAIQEAKRGVDVVVIDNPECRELMVEFIRNNPEIWYEDIGE